MSPGKSVSFGLIASSAGRVANGEYHFTLQAVGTGSSYKNSVNGIYNVQSPVVGPSRQVLVISDQAVYTQGTGVQKASFTLTVQEASGASSSENSWSPVPQAGVTFQLTLPDGSIYKGVDKTTGSKGKAVYYYSINSKIQKGEYRILVTGTYLDGTVVSAVNSFVIQ